MVQTRTIVGVGGVAAGLIGLAIVQLGNQSSDRQYKKTLQYMHDGRDKIAEKFDQATGTKK
jgi:hypothetical protein